MVLSEEYTYSKVKNFIVSFYLFKASDKAAETAQEIVDSSFVMDYASLIIARGMIFLFLIEHELRMSDFLEITKDLKTILKSEEFIEGFNVFEFVCQYYQMEPKPHEIPHAILYKN